MTHTFEPEKEILALNHLGGFITAAFVDKTSASISGQVHFDYLDW